jgi:DNA-binding MarR family transcriptional regulator
VDFYRATKDIQDPSNPNKRKTGHHVSEIAETLGVSRPTIHRALESKEEK